jgi:hypothetical protein
MSSGNGMRTEFNVKFNRNQNRTVPFTHAVDLGSRKNARFLFITSLNWNHRQSLKLA